MINDLRIADTVNQVSEINFEIPVAWIVVPLALSWMVFGTYLLFADMKAYGEYMRRDRDY